MRIQVDIKRSIKIGRVSATNLDLAQKVNIGCYIGLAILFIGVGLVLPTLILVQTFKGGSLNVIGMVFLSLFYVIGFLTVYGLINENKLKKIRGKDLKSNKRGMLSVLKRVYSTDLIYEGETILVYYKRATFWNFGLRVIVLFDQDYVLINLARFNQIGLKSFFHSLFSEMAINSLIRDFKQENKV